MPDLPRDWAFIKYVLRLAMRSSIDSMWQIASIEQKDFNRHLTYFLSVGLRT